MERSGRDHQLEAVAWKVHPKQLRRLFGEHWGNAAIEVIGTDKEGYIRALDLLTLLNLVNDPHQGFKQTYDAVRFWRSRQTLQGCRAGGDILDLTPLFLNTCIISGV